MRKSAITPIKDGQPSIRYRNVMAIVMDIGTDTATKKISREL